MVALFCQRFIDYFREDKKQVLVPGGCAHGFLCLNEATIIYSQGGTFDTSQEQVKSKMFSLLVIEFICRMYAHLILLLIFSGHDQNLGDMS